MRREGYELAVSQAARRDCATIDGVVNEPFEVAHGRRRGRAPGRGDGGARQPPRRARSTWSPTARGRTRLEYRMPARGLIGFQGEFMNLTRGTGLMSHVFDDYAPVKGDIPERRNGVLISQEDGEAVAYALWKLQERGRMFVAPGEPVYEGMIIGIHSRDNDLVVNPIKGKKLTNVRAVRQGRRDPADAADPADARVRGRVHRRRRARRGHAEVDPHPQALPEGARAQAREPRGGQRGGGGVASSPRIAGTSTTRRSAGCRRMLDRPHERGDHLRQRDEAEPPRGLACRRQPLDELHDRQQHGRPAMARPQHRTTAARSSR